MQKIIIDGIHPYSGEYEIDLGTFTNGDFHTIKRISGVRAGEFEAAAQAGDNDLLVAFAVVALTRHGVTVDENILWAASAGRITFEVDEADAVPPPQQNSNGDARLNEQSGSSGSGGSTAGDTHPENDPSSTGHPLSAISAI